MTEQNTRPWQGTTLGILNIIGIVFLTLILVPMITLTVIGFLIGGATAIQMPEFMPEGFMLIGTIAILIGLIISLIFYILSIIITVGVFKGTKWTIILSIIFSILGVISNIISAITNTDQINFIIIPLIIIAFFLYLEFACLNHPFYNKNKQIDTN